MCTVLYVCGGTVLVRAAEALRQHETKFYDLMRQTWCHIISAYVQLLSPSCLEEVNECLPSQELLLARCVFFVCDEMCLFKRACSCWIESVWLWLYSAGCGRTGAICAIDYTWNLLKAGVCEHTHTHSHTVLKRTCANTHTFYTLNVRI